MEVMIFVLVSSLLWVIGYPIIAYPFAKKLKTEYNCPNGIFAFAIFSALPIFATPFIAYVIILLVFFNRTLVTIPLFLYPFCIMYGIYLFYKSFSKNQNRKAVWYLIAIWGALILLVLSSYLILNSYRSPLFLE